MGRIRLLLGLLTLALVSSAGAAAIGPGNPPPVPMTAFARQFLSNQTATGARSLLGIADTNMSLATATNIVLWGHTTAESNFIVGAELRSSGGIRGDGYGITNVPLASVTNAGHLVGWSLFNSNTIWANVTNHAKVLTNHVEYKAGLATNHADLVSASATNHVEAKVALATNHVEYKSGLATNHANLVSASATNHVAAKMVLATNHVEYKAGLATNHADLVSVNATNHVAAYAQPLWSSTNSAPADPTNIVLWLEIVIGGVTNKLPLYQ